jgi:uncharacterized protein (TIGR00730 family)
MIRSICVFSSSSDAVASHYVAAASELGAALARRGLTLVYGGGRVGLMGVLARSVHAHGGRVVGVIPDFLRKHEVAYEDADELIVTRDMRARKAIMEERADAFVAMPGGFGTLEEILEILTLKQLATHAKPVVLLNTERFFDPLLVLFEQLFLQSFARPEIRAHYHVAQKPGEVFDHIEHYQSPPRLNKWFAPGPEIQLAEPPDRK